MAELLYINGSGTNVYGGYYTGQSFLTTGAWLVQSIWIDSVRTLTAGPFDVTCSIYLDGGSGPTGAALGVSDSVSCNNVLATKTFTFSTPVSLSNATKYWAIIDCAGADATWFVRTDTSAYADGEVGYGSSGDLSDFAGDSSYDCKQFKVNGLEAPSSYTSVQSGEWDDGDTWGYPVSAGGFYPSSDGDTANIAAGHTVTYSISADWWLEDVYINAGGTLTFNPSANTQMIVGEASVDPYIWNSGTLSIGTSAIPIHKDYTCKIYFDGLTSASYGITSTQDGTIINMYGDPNYRGNLSYTKMATGGDGNTIITLEDDVSGWNIGDEIIIHKHDLYSNYQSDFLLTSIIGISGTSLECADVVSTDFKVGGIVVHLTQNVVLGQLNNDDSMGNAPNAKRPQWTDALTYSNARKNIENIEFNGFYRTRNFAPDTATFRNCVFRSGYYPMLNMYGNSFYDCVWLQQSYTFFYSHGNYLENCLILSFNGTPFFYCHDHTLNDCHIKGGTGYMIDSSTNFTLNRCETSLLYTCKQSENLDIFDSALMGHTWSSGMAFNINLNFYNCKFGYDLDDRLIGMGTMFYTAYGNETYINCKFSEETEGYRDNPTYMCRKLFKDYNQVAGDDRIMMNRADIYVVDADGSGDNPTQRSGGSSRVYEYVSQSNAIYIQESIFKHKLHISSTLTKTIRYYIQTDYTNLTSNEIYLEAIYPSSATDSSTSLISSTNSISTRTNQSDWSQYIEVTISPLNTGWIELSFRLGAYESGKKIWIDPQPEVT